MARRSRAALVGGRARRERRRSRAGFRRWPRAREPVGRLAPGVADELALPREVVVAAGGGDAAVGAIGLGAIRPGDAFISLGTATQLIVASDSYRAAPEKLVHSFAHALPERWYRMAAMLNGAGALAFAARLFGREVAELEAEAASGYRGPGETMFLPYLSGERTPHDDPHARGVVFGLDEGASRVDVARAVMEGVAFTLADARDCLEAAGDFFARVGLIGGGAQERAVDAHDRRRARLRNRALSRRRDPARLSAPPGSRGSQRRGKRPKRSASRPTSPTSIAPDPALVEAFAGLRERFASLYRALKPEFAKAAATRDAD